MKALSAINEVYLANCSGRTLPKALIVPPSIWLQAFEEQRESCRRHHGADAMVSEHESRHHFLFHGVPAVCGLDDAACITAET